MQLRDQTRLELRPVGRDDKQLIRAGFERLGPRSRYRCIHGPMPELGERMLGYLTEVDHHDHEALLALDAASGDAVGLASFVRDPSEPLSAEIAVSVVDDLQGRGLGTALAEALARRARQEGIVRFRGLVLAENRAMLRLIAHFGPTRTIASEFGSIELAVDLPTEVITQRPYGRSHRHGARTPRRPTEGYSCARRQHDRGRASVAA